MKNSDKIIKLSPDDERNQVLKCMSPQNFILIVLVKTVVLRHFRRGEATRALDKDLSELTENSLRK